MSKEMRYAAAVLLLIPELYFWKYLFTIEDGVTFTNSIIMLPLAAALWKLTVKSLESDVKYYKYVMPLGILCAFMLVWGIRISRILDLSEEAAELQRATNGMETLDVPGLFQSKGVWIACIVYGILWGMLLGKLFHWLDERKTKKETLPHCLESVMESKYFRWFCMAFMLLAWTPVWLASYPGFFCYDVGVQYQMFVNGTITRHHPAIHTWLLGVFLSVSQKLTGSANPGIAVLTWVQMIFLAFVFSEVLQYIKKVKAGGFTVLGGLLVYSFLPTIQIYVGCTTKDLLYTGFFMLLILRMIQWTQEPDEYWWSSWRKLELGVVMFLAMAFRNNALYVVAAFVVMALFLLKVRRRPFFIVAVVAIIAYLLYNGPVLDSFGVGPGSAKEMLSVPIQQLGRVYIQNTDSYSESDKELLFKTIPKEWWDCYQPKTSDAIKGATKSDFDEQFYAEHRGELFRLWLQTGLKNPALYAEAFLFLTVDSWCPDSVLDGHVGYFYSKDMVQSCYYTPQVDEPGVLESKIPWLFDKIVDIGYHISFQKIPVISMLFSVGAMFWLYLITLVYALYCRDRQVCLVLLLPGLSFATHLLGPMVLVRYHLILFFMIPLYLWILFGQDEGPLLRGEKSRTEETA